MDTPTILLLLALGSYVVWAILLAFQAGMPHARRIPHWTAAKFLQATGSLALWLRGPSPDFATVLLANLPLLLGCAGEAWAVSHITGRAVPRRTRQAVAWGVAALCGLGYFMAPGARSATVFALHALFYALPAWALLRDHAERRALRAVLGGSFLLMAALFAAHALWLAAAPQAAPPEFQAVTFLVIPPATYCMLLVSGFTMLLLAKEKADTALEESHRMLEALSSTDGLTGIANRRRFDQALAEECARHARTGAALSLILLDLDHFKRFNDAHGHVAGDECLRRVGALLAAAAARAGDLAARYGGEEFACILPATDEAGALGVARAIRRGIEDLEVPGAPGGVTASLGVLTERPGPDRDPRELLRRIDRLLYKAKAGGRNRVESLGSDQPGPLA